MKFMKTLMLLMVVTMTTQATEAISLDEKYTEVFECLETLRPNFTTEYSNTFDSTEYDWYMHNSFSINDIMDQLVEDYPTDNCLDTMELSDGSEGTYLNAFKLIFDSRMVYRFGTRKTHGYKLRLYDRYKAKAYDIWGE